MGIDAQMLVKTEVQVTPDQVRDWAYELASAFGPDNFFIARPGDKYFKVPRHCLTLVDEYQQDGPSLEPADGEMFIEVHLMTRYYGAGYERGDLPLIIAVADWLERRIPKAEVWYGGDSSGVLAAPFDAQAREKLWSHFCAVGHAPYTDYFDHSDDGIEVQTCELCKRKMRRCGWGGGGQFAAFYCSGCGFQIETHDGGETFQEKSR